MSKSDDAADILSDAGQNLECVRMAVSSLDSLKADPIMTVIDTTARKIEAAIALLEKCDAEAGDAA